MATGSDRYMPGHEIYEALGNRQTFDSKGRRCEDGFEPVQPIQDHFLFDPPINEDVEDMDIDRLYTVEEEMEEEEMEVGSYKTPAEEETCNEPMETAPSSSAPPQILTISIAPSGPPNNEWSGDNTQAMGSVIYNFLSNKIITLVLDFIGYQWHPIVTISQAGNHQTQVESTQNTTRMVHEHLTVTMSTNGAREGGVTLTTTNNAIITLPNGNDLVVSSRPLSTDNHDYVTGTGRQCTDDCAGATNRTGKNNRQFVVPINLPDVDTKCL